MRAVNLLPRDSKHDGRRLTVAGQLALVAPFVVGSALAAGYLLASANVSDNKVTLRQVQDELAALPAPNATPPVNLGLAVQLDQRISAVGAALQNRIAWDRVLSEVSAVLPADIWLSSLTAQAPPRPVVAPSTTTTTTATQATVAPALPVTGPLTLTGYAYSPEGVARLLGRLALVPLLQDVKLVQSAKSLIGSQTVYSFSIQAGVRGQETG